MRRSVKTLSVIGLVAIIAIGAYAYYSLQATEYSKDVIINVQPVSQKAQANNIAYFALSLTPTSSSFVLKNLTVAVASGTLVELMTSLPSSAQTRYCYVSLNKTQCQSTLPSVSNFPAVDAGKVARYIFTNLNLQISSPTLYHIAVEPTHNLNQTVWFFANGVSTSALLTS